MVLGFVTQRFSRNTFISGKALSFYDQISHLSFSIYVYRPIPASVLSGATIVDKQRDFIEEFVEEAFSGHSRNSSGQRNITLASFFSQVRVKIIIKLNYQTKQFKGYCNVFGKYMYLFQESFYYSRCRRSSVRSGCFS